MIRDDKILMVLGEVKGELRGVRHEVKGVRRQVELQRISLEEQGKVIAALPCDARRKQISDLYESVGRVKEDTGVTHIREIERKAKWSLATKVGVVLISVVSAAAAMWKIFG